jgi:uncharacterized repeat protein (TIGR03803 family)
VYELSTSGQETVQHSFNGTDLGGGAPYTGVIRDSSGNLYGTTSVGGGVLYEVDAAGDYMALRQFLVGFGTSKPEGELVRDSAGNFYGTTQYGGKANAGANGVGTVFEIAPSGGTPTALYSFCAGSVFPDCTDGAFPKELVHATNGDLYGIIYGGGGDLLFIRPMGLAPVRVSFKAGFGRRNVIRRIGV